MMGLWINQNGWRVSSGAALRLLAMLFAICILTVIRPSAALAVQPVLACSSGTTNFDWDTPANTWTAGSLNNSYTVTNLGTINYAITTTGGAWVNNATYGGLAPFRQNIDTYGLGGQFTLQQWIDFTTNTQTATTTISLRTAGPSPVPAAVPGLQFSILDVDFNATGFTDRIVVTGTFNGAPVTANLATHNATPSYTITGNTAVGNATSAATSQNGRVWVTFSSPVDTVTVTYGNGAGAPANPSGQAIDFHDITFCRPVATLSATKISSVLSDGVGASNPKAIPGAVVRYCITTQNNGSGTTTNVSASDALPANVTYVPGSMTTGASCGTATNAEDDNNAGTDESDPYGMSVTGTTVTGTATALAPSATFAMAFRVTVN
jgi:uncharacterized repeat protein (TIGR01451 family)